MEGFDIRELWQEGRLFMKESEYNTLLQVVPEMWLVHTIADSCDIADAAILKMMRG